MLLVLLLVVETVGAESRRVPIRRRAKKTQMLHARKRRKIDPAGAPARRRKALH
jgi:hypothetical protein